MLCKETQEVAFKIFPGDFLLHRKMGCAMVILKCGATQKEADKKK
jgi:hypothetical protein